MRKLFRRTFFSFLILFILIAGTLSFFLSTTPGLYASIRIGQLFLPGTVEIHQLKGRLIDDFSIGELVYHYDTSTVKITNINLSWQFKDLLNHQLLIKKFSADSLILSQNDTSKIINNILFSGLLNKQDGEVQQAFFTFLDQKVSLNFKFKNEFPNSLSGTIQFNPINSAINRLTGKISFGGTIEQMDWAGDLFGSANCSIKGSLKQLKDITQVIKWTDLKWKLNDHQIFSSPQGRINLSGSLPNIHMDVITKFSTQTHDNWQTNAKINGVLPWQWEVDANLIPPQSEDTLLAGLHTTISAQGTIKDKNHGNLNITINPGNYHPPTESMLSPIPFKGGTIKAVLTPQSLQAQGMIAIDDTKKLNVVFKLPHFDLMSGMSPKQALSGNVSLTLNSLNFLDDLTPEINKVRGNLIASLKVIGTLGNAHIESKLNLSSASLSMPNLGLDLDGIHCKLITKSNHWEATVSISSTGKLLTLTGKGPLSSKFLGQITLQGSDFPIAKTQEYQINISPKLKVNITPATIHIAGSILVPNAHIKPQTFNNSLTLPDDVVYKTNKQHKTTTLNSNANTSMDVAVEMGDQVELTFKGLHATLAGKVNIKQLPQGPMNANGELTVKEGEYKAYGQDLDIEQGQLFFTGGSLDNPGINLKASKVIGNNTSTFNTDTSFDLNNSNLQNINLGNNIKVGVEVTGRLTAPKILLFSNPAILSQADILSMLVLGRPASQANKAGGQLLLAAISSMNLGTKTNGAQLLDQLKQTVGLDFNVQTNTNYNQLTNQVTDTTSFVVGKALSKRLYLSYNVGLSQADPNVLTLKYLLNKLFSVQVTNSLKGSGIDLLYSRSKDKINE